MKLSSLEWWSLLAPFSGTAFLSLLSGGAAWPPPSFGRAAFLPLFWVTLVPGKSSTSPKRAKHQKRKEKQPLPKDGKKVIIFSFGFLPFCF